MDNIKKLINNINNSNNISDRIDLIKQLNKELLDEKENQKKIQKKVDENNSRLSKKYKSLSISELKEEFNKVKKFSDKIKIYETINFKINDLEKNLFVDINI